MSVVKILVDFCNQPPTEPSQMKSMARQVAKNYQDSFTQTSIQTWFSKYKNGNYIGDVYEFLTWLGVVFGVGSKKEGGGFAGLVNWNAFTSPATVEIDMQRVKRVLGKNDWFLLYIMNIILETGWDILPQSFENLNLQNELLVLAYDTATKNHPKSSQERRCDFVNIVKLLVTGDNQEGYGGPRVRELLAEQMFETGKLGVKEVFKKLLDPNGPVFGPLNSEHQEIWKVQSDYCFDTDPWEEAILCGFDNLPTRINFTVGQQGKGHLIVWGDIKKCLFDIEEYGVSYYSKNQRLTINVQETKILGAVNNMLQNNGWQKIVCQNLKSEDSVTFEKENSSAMNFFDEFALLIHNIREAITYCSISEPKITL